MLTDMAKQERLKASARFVNKTRMAEGGCVVWTGGRKGRGYGQFYIKGVAISSHRFSYMMANSEYVLPKGMMVCHTCDNPSCVNPEHLWLGTRSDNMMDASNKGRIWKQSVTHCPNGHKYTEENTYLRQGKWRDCKECARAASRRWYHKNQEQPND